MKPTSTATFLMISFALAFTSIAHAQSFVDEFSDAFDDGNPVQWGAFGTDRGVVSVSDGAAKFASTTGASQTFGIGVDVTHADVVSDMTARFINGNENTHLLNNLRDFPNSTHQGQYWTALSQSGEIGIGLLTTDGNIVTTVRGVFLPTGSLGPNDIVNMRSKVTGSTIVHSAWLDGMDVSTGATVTWTDPLDRFPTGDIVAISFAAGGNSSAEVDVLSYSLTLVPEPTGGSLLMSSFSLCLPLLRHRSRQQTKSTQQ